VLAITLALMVLLAPSSALASTKAAPSGVYVPEASVMTMDGTVLWQRNAKKPRRVASCIKMLNALVARDEAELDDMITVSEKAEAVDGGAIGLRKGQKISVRQLLTVLLVHSANGAGTALASGIAGSEKKYVKMMNAKAKALGLKNTHAVDPHGLSKKESSTAADLSVIARELMADPELRAIVRQHKARVSRGGSSAVFSTTNRLLGVYRGIEGVKTGYTDPAGYCFVAVAKRDGVELCSVVLGADNGPDRFTQTRRLLDWGFAHTSRKQMVSCEQTMGVVEVSDGAETAVPVHSQRELTMTVGDCGDTLTRRVVLPSSVRAPVVAGKVLGAVQIVRGSTVVTSVPLVADTAVAPKARWGFRMPGPHDVSGKEPGLVQRVAAVMAGFGRMLGL
jgi:serine-type D-Ala-D-Ala carboxypeptidase (penicillin-binding protein 5/6)